MSIDNVCFVCHAFVQKKSGNTYKLSTPNNRLSELAGIDALLNQVKEIVFYPVRLGALYKHIGVLPPTGVLLTGPSGCGKTTLAHAIAGELQIPFFKVFSFLEYIHV
jgi:ATP-dependent 26S proteasome regulatory subunit